MFREHSNREKQQQRFGFRKYKAGVSSVLLAVAFLGAVLPSFVAPMATIVYAGTRIPGSKAELNDAAAKSVDLSQISTFDFTSLLKLNPGYSARINYIQVGKVYGNPADNYADITAAGVTGQARVNFTIYETETGKDNVKADGQVDIVTATITVTNTPPVVPDKDKYQPTTEGITVPKHSKITEDDIKNKVTIPEGSGGTIKTVGEIPSTSTDGVKTPVTVTVEYPDGTSDEVTVPVTVTPADDPTTDSITVPQDEPITEDLVKSKVTIPDGTGGTIKSVGEIPSTTTAGVKPPVTVVVEYPNGDTVEVTVPVTVTPKVPSTTPIEVPQHSIVTEDVVKGKVVIPEGSGGKITNVGTIPTTNTAGEKPAVPVTVTYDDGTSVVVDVPVTVTPVTPTAGDITVPQHTPITENDVKNKVTIPEGSNGVITKVTNIPTTTEAGKKPEAEVTVTYPNGDTEIVKVPITVTPVTPTTEGITVPQGTPITEKDVTNKVTVPAGGKITTIGEIPSTDTAGDKPAVEVIITYPNGDTEVVKVPVTVTTKVPMKSNTDKVTPDAGMTTPKTADKKVLPKTGENSSMATVYGVILAILSMFGLAVSRRKEEK